MSSGDAGGADVVIVGAGVIGSAIAWRAATGGLDVVVVDPRRKDGASLVAAGILAPVAESFFGQDALLALNLLAAARFPGFAEELEDVTGTTVGLRRDGTLAVAFDADDRAALARLTEFRKSVGLDAMELDGRACRALEPLLAPGVQSGVLFGGDWSVDNRRYAAALDAAATSAGASWVSGSVAEVITDQGRVSGVRLAGADDVIVGAHVVVAAGCWSGAITGLPAALKAVIRPVKGQLLRLRLPQGMPPVLTRAVRAIVHGTDVYVVPRADGEVVVGATVEERGFEQTVTAGAVRDLLDDATRVIPMLSELVLAEACVGLRPGTPDNGPVVGATGIDGLLMAGGHYRDGILLSAATADAVVALLNGERPAAEWEPFAPTRFTAGRQ